MRKFLALPALAILLTFANVSSVSAVTTLDSCNDNDQKTACNVLNPVCVDNPSSVLCGEAAKKQTITDNGLFGKNGILNKVANLLLIVVAAISVIMITVGGIMYSLSGGESQKVNQAKDMIIYAIVGIFVALVAKGVIAFVINKIA